MAGAGSQMLTAGGVTYGYDANGNQTSRSSDTFTYDHQNHLTQAVIGGRNSSFVYNGDGLRMSYTVGGSTTDYSWDVAGGLPVILQDGTNTYVYGLDLISATDGGGVQTYYLYDGLGSTAGLADGSGNGVASYGYDVFGAIRSETGGQANDYRFTGQQFDVASGLYYLRARYYDPASGRFPTRDSFRGWFASPQSQNPYAYVTNNPVFYVDPLGLWGLGDLADAAGGIGDALGDAADTVGAALGDVELDDLGYIDLNGTVCLGLCLTAGFQASFGEGVHPYVGGGGGSPQLSGNVTVAPGQHITTGWNCGAQIAIGGLVAPTVQVGGAGRHHDKEGNMEWERGFVEIGVSIGLSPVAAGTGTCVYIW